MVPKTASALHNSLNAAALSRLSNTVIMNSFYVVNVNVQNFLRLQRSRTRSTFFFIKVRTAMLLGQSQL